MMCDNGSGADDDYDADVIDDNADELTPASAAALDPSNRTLHQVSPQPSVGGGCVPPPVSGCASPNYSNGSPVQLTAASALTSTSGAEPPQGDIQMSAE